MKANRKKTHLLRVLGPHITEENESLQLLTKLGIVCCISVQIQTNYELSFEIFFLVLKLAVRLWSLLIYISVITVYSQIPLFYRIQIIKTLRITGLSISSRKYQFVLLDVT